MRKKTQKAIEDRAQACYDYMLTPVGKDKVLNPPGHKPIMKIDWQPNVFTEKVQERVRMYVSEYLQTKDVLQKFRKIKDETSSFYQKKSADLSKMETGWTGWTGNTEDRTSKMPTLSKEDSELSTASFVGIVLATSPLWIPLLATGVGLTISASPIIFPVVKFLGRDKRKEKLIHEEYRRWFSTIQGFICKELESNQGRVIYKLVDKVTDDLILGRIQSLQKMIQQLSKSRREIISNVDTLSDLAKKINIIEGSATELLDFVAQEIKATETGMH